MSSKRLAHLQEESLCTLSAGIHEVRAGWASHRFPKITYFQAVGTDFFHRSAAVKVGRLGVSPRAVEVGFGF